MATLFCGAFCTKCSRGVFGTQSYIQYGLLQEKLTALSIFAKNLGVWQGSKYATFHESLQKSNF